MPTYFLEFKGYGKCLRLVLTRVVYFHLNNDLQSIFFITKVSLVFCGFAGRMNRKRNSETGLASDVILCDMANVKQLITSFPVK